MNQKEEVAIYCRLSKEDENKARDDNSDSIINQKNLLTKYANEQGWHIYDYYIDDDYAGSDRNRPDFNRMLSDLLVGPPKIVLCKQQSRFARDIELVEKYIHGIFLEKGIRFIALLDHIDTKNQNASTRRSSQINSLVDEWYLADMSENITTTLRNLQEQGKYIGAFAPFGYRKDPQDKHHLIIDPEAAEIVKLIFDCFTVQNMGAASIARNLNNQGIPTPRLYNSEHGLSSYKGDVRNSWCAGSVRSILKNPVYLGHIAQHKYCKPNYKSKKLISLDESEWIVVENCHEPIITQETWDRKLERAENRRKSFTKPYTLNLNKHPLSGKIFCGICGSKMIRSSSRHGSKSFSYFYCRLHREAPEECPGVRIRADLLHELILERFHKLSEDFFDEAFQSERIKQFQKKEQTEMKQLKKQLEGIHKNLMKLKHQLESLYQDKLEGIISKEEYLEYKQKFLNQQQAMMEEEAYVSNRIKERDGHMEEYQKVQSILEQYKEIDNLTHAFAGEMIQSVLISKNQQEETVATINWNF